MLLSHYCRNCLFYAVEDQLGQIDIDRSGAQLRHIAVTYIGEHATQFKNFLAPDPDAKNPHREVPNDRDIPEYCWFRSCCNISHSSLLAYLCRDVCSHCSGK